LVTHKPISFDECIAWARHVFQELFHNSIVQLLYNFPVDQVTSSGVPFWSGHKRPPTPVVFDVHDQLHLDFIIAASNLRAQIYGLRGDTDVKHFHRVLGTVSVFF
jgi:ubiquitin-activating enzyme E1